MPSHVRTAICLSFMFFVLPLQAQPGRPGPANPDADFETGPAAISDADRHFLRKAMQASLASIETGTLAWSKGSHGDIKLFGRRMYDTHSKTLRELQSLAKRKSISLPLTADAAYEAKALDLSRASAEEFDRLYVRNSGIGDCAAAKRLFKQGARSKDADIRAFAEKALLHIEDHLRMAQQLSKNI